MVSSCFLYVAVCLRGFLNMVSVTFNSFAEQNPMKRVLLSVMLSVKFYNVLLSVCIVGLPMIYSSVCVVGNISIAVRLQLFMLVLCCVVYYVLYFLIGFMVLFIWSVRCWHLCCDDCCWHGASECYVH